MRKTIIRHRLLHQLFVPLFISTWLLMISASAVANDPFVLIEKLLQQPAVSLSFRQVSYDTKGTPLEDITGTLAFKHKPTQFRLEYDDASYPLVVSDGTTVWLYQADLRQVIVQPLASARKNGLIEILVSGSLDVIKTSYVLTGAVDNSSTSEPLSWLNADAKHSDTDVKRFRFGFSADGTLRELFMVDHFDNTIHLTTRTLTYEPQAESLFSFVPPANSEIVQAQ